MCSILHRIYYIIAAVTGVVMYFYLFGVFNVFYYISVVLHIPQKVFIVFGIQYTLYFIQWIVYKVQCTVYKVQCLMYAWHYRVHRKRAIGTWTALDGYQYVTITMYMTHFPTTTNTTTTLPWMFPFINYLLRNKYVKCANLLMVAEWKKFKM